MPGDRRPFREDVLNAAGKRDSGSAGPRTFANARASDARLSRLRSDVRMRTVPSISRDQAEGGGLVSGPFIVKTVSRIHPGKAEAYRPVVSEFCKLVEETEPRLLAFHIYVTEDQSSEVVVQVHPDAESMQYHLDVMGKKVRETFAYSDFREPRDLREPNDELREWIERVSEEFRSLCTRCTGVASRGSLRPERAAG